MKPSPFFFANSSRSLQDFRWNILHSCNTWLLWQKIHLTGLEYPDSFFSSCLSFLALVLSVRVPKREPLGLTGGFILWDSLSFRLPDMSPNTGCVAARASHSSKLAISSSVTCLFSFSLMLSAVKRHLSQASYGRRFTIPFKLSGLSILL